MVYLGLKVEDPLGAVTAEELPGVLLKGEAVPGVMVVVPGRTVVVLLEGELKVLDPVPGIVVVPVVAVVAPGSSVPLPVPGSVVPVVVVVEVVVVVRVPDPVTVPPVLDAAPAVVVLAEVVVAPALAPYRSLVGISPLTMALVGISCGPTRCIVSTL